MLQKSKNLQWMEQKRTFTIKNSSVFVNSLINGSKVGRSFKEIVGLQRQILFLKKSVSESEFFISKVTNSPILKLRRASEFL